MLDTTYDISNVSLPVTELFWLFFYCLMVAFLIHAIIVCYHWYTYGTGGLYQTIFIATYLTGGVMLFISLLITLLA